MAIDRLIQDARDAGASTGTAHRKLCDALELAAVSYGLTDYMHGDIVAMRNEFANACATSGTSKKNGLSLFARAWDACIEKLSLQPRPRKGKGRNGGTGDADASADPDAPKPASISKEDKAKISAEAVAKFVKASGIEVALLDSLAETWEALKAVDSPIAKDAIHVVRSFGVVVGKALIAAGMQTESDCKARITEAAKRGKAQADAYAAAQEATATAKAAKPAKPALAAKPAKAAKPAVKPAKAKQQQAAA